MAEPVEIHIPFTTLLKIALTLLLCICIVKLWPVLVMVVVAALLAAMFGPLVTWLEAHHVRRALGITLVGVVMFGSIILFVSVLVPAMSHQLVQVSGELPRLGNDLSQRYPRFAPFLKTIRIPQTLPASAPMKLWLSRGLAAGMYAIEGVTMLILVLVLALYLLIEGKTAFEWLVSLAPQSKRRRLRQTGIEMSGVGLAYMRGQAITCFICGGWAYLVLLVLGIPAALPLAVIAFVADLVPVVGTIAMTLPAVLLALTVGPMKAALVLAAYLFYHLAESYFIVPRVYGRQMRLSTLTVLLAITVGGTLQGVVGAILILPFVAAYPIVERIWLRDQLPEDTVARHEALAEGE
jgi:predicted PurR-regulated permease PerM